MKLREFKKSVEVIMGGMNGEILLMGKRNVGVEGLDKSYMFEYNDYLDMLLVSDVEGNGVMFYNKEVNVEDVIYGVSESFFDMGRGSESELGYRILEDDEINEVLS
jgi:hypothetical protein